MRKRTSKKANKDIIIFRRGDFYTVYNTKNAVYYVGGKNGLIAEFDTDAAATAYCKQCWIESCNLDDGK